MIVFDLDGCLIDSEELIRRCYADIGVELPDGFMKLPPGTWHDRGSAIHAARCAAYLKRLASDPFLLLPPWKVAQTLYDRGYAVALLTSAPEGAARVLRDRVSSWPFTFAFDGLMPADKEVQLRLLGPGGTYVDDQRHVEIPEGWRFVHYTGQDASELMGLCL